MMSQCRFLMNMKQVLKRNELIFLCTYGYFQLIATGTILIGNLTIIIQYVQRMINNFYNFIWQYSNIVPMVTAIEGAAVIHTAYSELPEVYSLPPLRHWKTIAINDLQFTYKDMHTHSHTLDHISMQIHA